MPTPARPRVKLSLIGLVASLLLVGIAVGEVRSVNPGFDLLQGQISSPSERDVFPFDIVEDAVLTIKLKVQKGDSLKPTIQIWDPDLVPLEGVANATKVSKKGDKLTVKKLSIPTTGRHYLVVQGTDEGAGQYQIKWKAKLPKKRVIEGEVLETGGETYFEFPAWSQTISRLTITRDKKWSDGSGSGTIEPVPTRIVTPTGAETPILELITKPGKALVKFAVFNGFGLHRVYVEAEPGTRGGFQVKATKIKYEAAAKRTVIDSEILIPPEPHSITPSSGYVDDMLEGVEVDGIFFQDGAKVLLQKGDTVHDVPAVEFVDDRTLRFDLDVTQMGLGDWDVVVENFDKGRGSIPAGFQVQNVPVGNLSMTPNSGRDNESVAVTIFGDNIRQGGSVRLVRGVEEIPADDIAVFEQQGMITAEFDLTGRLLGFWNLEVTNLGSVPTVLTNAMEILNAGPTVTGFLPNKTYSPTGDVAVTVEGREFEPGAEVELFRTGETSIPSTVTSVTGDTITANLNVAGKKAGAWNVRVTNADGQSATLDDVFTVFGAIGSVGSNTIDKYSLGSPDVAINTTDEEYLAVWAELDGSGNYAIKAQRYDLTSGDTVGSRMTLSTDRSAEDATDEKRDPAVAWSSGSNRYFVAWAVSLPNSSSTDVMQIWGRVLSNTGATVGNATKVTDSQSPTSSPFEEYDNGNPNVDYDPQANLFHVTFDHHWQGTPGDWDTIHTTVGMDGKVGTTGSKGIEFEEREGGLAWDSRNGRVLVVYTADEASGGTATGKKTIQATADFAGYSTGDVVAEADKNSDPTVAVSPEEDMALVVWVLDGDKIMAQRIRASDYGVLGDLYTIASASGETNFSPRVVWNPLLGEFLVIWTRYTTSGTTLRAQRFGRDDSVNPVSWKPLGSAFTMSGGSGKEGLGVPSYLPTDKLYFCLWLGDVTKSGSDFLGEKVMSRRWK